MINIIIGKNSNLSKLLKENIENGYLISSQNIYEDMNKIRPYISEEVNIIFNNFQVSTRLNDLSNPTEYINRSILTTANVLNYILEHGLRVNKIIYTSSSSVYGSNEFCREGDPLQPLTLHSSLKIANERLIESFAISNRIDYTITRIFNMYGGDDNFSIISKIIKANRENGVLNIFNNGISIRDFIHIDDVIKIYKILLQDRINFPILNVGRGVGMSVRELLNFLNQNGIDIKTKNKFRNELKKSTADVSRLLTLIGENEFVNIKEFLLQEMG